MSTTASRHKSQHTRAVAQSGRTSVASQDGTCYPVRNEAAVRAEFGVQATAIPGHRRAEPRRLSVCNAPCSCTKDRAGDARLSCGAMSDRPLANGFASSLLVKRASAGKNHSILKRIIRFRSIPLFDSSLIRATWAQFEIWTR
jgi:hypothetical protein